MKRNELIRTMNIDSFRLKKKLWFLGLLVFTNIVALKGLM